jgi:hypothetical protein
MNPDNASPSRLSSGTATNKSAPKLRAFLMVLLCFMNASAVKADVPSNSGHRSQTARASAQPAASEVQAHSDTASDAFAKNNPGYAERAGAFYEKEYLGKALNQLGAVVQLTDEQKLATRKILRAFVTDCLESYASGGGQISKEDLERCLATMDAKFKGELPQAGYEAYLAWRKDETGGSNALAFLMNPRFAIPQTPSSLPEWTEARQTEKIQLTPLGFHTIDFSKDFWASLTEDSKLTGKVADVLAYEQIKRMVILRCNLHVPDGDYLETFIRGWLTGPAGFYPGPFPDNAARDLRSPFLTVLFENEKGERGLLTVYSDVAVVELNSRYGLLLKRSGGHTDSSYPEMRADLETLRKHDQHHFNASPAVMEAARRVFDIISFVGKTDEQVRGMLGEPYEVTKRNQETLWDYMFHDGEGGVHRRLVFAGSSHEVKRVEEIMTE